MHFRLVLVGFGHVARRFVRLIEESRPALTALDIHPVVTAIVTRRHGGLVDAAGLDAELVLRRQAAGESLGSVDAAGAIDWAASQPADAAGASVLVETTTLNVETGEPALTHVTHALGAGLHVVTANKGPAAFAYRRVMAAARAADRAFLFEGAVMDGVPIFNLVRETLPAVTIQGFRGVVNSTTNYVLTAMEQGERFADALVRMQAAGVAEADPSLDIDGWDAAAKAAALANAWLDADLTPAAVTRDRIDESVGARAREARAAGRRLKLVASARGRGAQATARVALETLDPDDPLAILPGQANALELDAPPIGRIVITQRDGGLEKTAYALVTDLVAVRRRYDRAPAPRRSGLD